MAGGFTFVHAADLHLDSQFRGLQQFSEEDTWPEFVRREIRESTFTTLRRIVDLVLDRQAAFLLIAGDVYEAAEGSLRAQLRLRDELVRLAERGIPTFIVHGNHDHCGVKRPAITFPDTVHFFSHRDVEWYPVLRQGKEIARVYGISYPQRDVNENYALRFKRHREAPFAIGLLHCNVGGVPEHENYAPCKLQDLLASGFDYWALGHIHRPYQVLHREAPAVIYPGNPQGRHPGETGDRGCCVVTVGDNGRSTVEFVPLNAVTWEVKPVTIDGVENLDRLRERLVSVVGKVQETNRQRSVVIRLQLIGRGILHSELRKHHNAYDLLYELRESCVTEMTPFVWPETLQVLTRPPVDKDELAQTDTLLGDLLNLARQVREDPGLQQQLRASLDVLLNHHRAGRYLSHNNEEELWMLLERAEDMAIDYLQDGDE
ncbi:MAG: DNA repair exonuclease [Peptococcaceae bacterium]|nr:DNA repair exonuclease [Peptococcaceae bacterium]